jgi:hypothetical protein
MDALTTGQNNIALGFNTLDNITTVSDLTAVGNDALQANTTGVNNIAFGRNALKANTTGSRNTAVGANTLVLNTVGNSNTAVGSQSLNKTTGSDNIGIGQAALFNNTTGNNNISIGSGSLDQNTTGSNNVAIGAAALALNTTSGFNTGIGSFAVRNNITGASNTGIGYAALESAIGNSNTAVGRNALAGVTTGNLNTGVGNGAGGFGGTTSEQTFVGAGTGQLNGSGVLTVGTIVGGSGYTDGTYTNIPLFPQNFNYFGYPVIVNMAVSGGSATITAGVSPGSGYSVGQVLIINPAFYPSYPAGLLAGSGFSAPVATITTTQRNTAIGRGAIQNNYNGSNNTAIGYFAGRNSAGSGSVFVGYEAGTNETQSNKLYIANSSTSTPLIGGDFSAGTVTVNGSLTTTGTFKVGETSITRDSNSFKIKKNDAAADALTINFDPSGGAGNTFAFNGAMVISGSGPATSTGGGNFGQLGFDNDYLYICISGGAPGSATWKRVALTSF